MAKQNLHSYKNKYKLPYLVGSKQTKHCPAGIDVGNLLYDYINYSNVFQVLCGTFHGYQYMLKG